MHSFVEKVAALAGLALLSCGGVVVVDGSDGGSGAAGGSSAAGGGKLCSVDGIRLCGGSHQQCPVLSPPTCPGYGCTEALDTTTDALSVAGVCWSDLPQAGAEPCVACADGDVCVQRTPDELICTTPGVCQRLALLGATTVCRYADKSLYDGKTLPAEPSACPVAAGSEVLCGGACGACAPDTPCTGRSPRHPIGACPVVQIDGTHGSIVVEPCQLDASGHLTIHCDVGTGHLCAVFDDAFSDEGAAETYGFCMEAPSCKLAAARLPGGISCFDDHGQKVAP